MPCRSARATSRSNIRRELGVPLCTRTGRPWPSPRSRTCSARPSPVTTRCSPITPVIRYTSSSPRDALRSSLGTDDDVTWAQQPSASSPHRQPRRDCCFGLRWPPSGSRPPRLDPIAGLPAVRDCGSQRSPGPRRRSPRDESRPLGGVALLDLSGCSSPGDVSEAAALVLAIQEFVANG